jgi:NitT/TauT family transport system substrate-binding protein
MLMRLTLLLILLVSSPANLQGQELHLASYAGIAAGTAPLWVTKDQGLFEKYGLNAGLVYIPGGARGIQALVAGSIHFYTGDGLAPMSAMLGGADVVIIGVSENKIPGALVTRKEIQKPLDLRGKRVGIVNFGGSNELSVVLALRKWNIPREAVTFVISGGVPDRLAALASGATDASPLPPPQSFLAPRMGMNMLIDLADIPAFPQTSIAVRRSFLEKNRDTVRRFIQAYSEGIHVFTTNREKAMATFRKWLRQQDPKILDETYNYYQKKFSLPPRTVRGEGLSLGHQMIAERVGKEVTEGALDRFIEETVTEQLEKEGFFKRLHGK